jgi:hypothetical protein
MKCSEPSLNWWVAFRVLRHHISQAHITLRLKLAKGSWENPTAVDHVAKFWRLFIFDRYWFVIAVDIGVNVALPTIYSDSILVGNSNAGVMATKYMIAS